jgi:steroid delta-isomerase-like uncharacterized protein
MASDDLKAMVRRELEEVYGAGDLDVVDEIVSKGYVGHDSAIPEPLRGPSAVKDAAAGYRAAFPDLRLTIETQIAEGDIVVTRWTATGTHQGELFGIAPTGKQATVSGISIDRFSGGKVAESWTNWDTLGLLQQLGAVAAPTPT